MKRARHRFPTTAVSSRYDRGFVGAFIVLVVGPIDDDLVATFAPLTPRARQYSAFFRACDWCGRLNPNTGFSTSFFQQGYFFQAHAAINRFAHIVDGEQPRGNGSERFHLDAGAAFGFDGGDTVDGDSLAIQLEFDIHMRESERVA